MARISTYNIDTSVQKTDKLLGSNLNGDTRNFTVDGVREYFNQDSSAGAADELNYQYYTDTTNTVGAMSTNTGSAPAFSDISTLKIHEKANGLEVSVSDFFNEFINKDIVIVDSTNLNNYGVYTVTTVAADGSNSGLYDLTLTHKSSNGTLVNERFYSLLLFSGAQDKEFVHVQNSSASSWTVNHNLNKFPAVTVKLSSGAIGTAGVAYNSKNQLTVSLSGANTGTAYLN